MSELETTPMHDFWIGELLAAGWVIMNAEGMYEWTPEGLANMMRGEKPAVPATPDESEEKE